jgi:hypothetical protein
VQLHYAGGRWSNGVLIDSHDSATSEAVWELFGRIAARTPVKAAVLERDERLPQFTELLAETDRARQLMKGANCSPPRPSRINAWAAVSHEREHEQPLAQTQRLLARLFTDADFRGDFFADPEAAGRSGLETLDAGAVAHFSNSLTGKRLLDARKALPLTAKALGTQFAPLLRAQLQGPPRAGRHRADAAALVARLAAGDASPAWIADLARYEMAFAEATAPGPLLILRRFRWPPQRLAAAALSGGTPGAPKMAFCLWLRLPGAPKLLHWTL